jgi:hypothetical protein
MEGSATIIALRGYNVPSRNTVNHWQRGRDRKGRKMWWRYKKEQALLGRLVWGEAMAQGRFFFGAARVLIHYTYRRRHRLKDEADNFPVKMFNDVIEQIRLVNNDSQLHMPRTPVQLPAGEPCVWIQMEKMT